MSGPALNVLSLFSGIGGLELGLERVGMTVVGQVEINDYCRRVLAKHWPNVPRHDDVRTAAEWWLNSPCSLCAGTPGYAGGLLGDCFCRRRARGDNGQRIGREGIERRPRVDVVCGGFPCQPFSVSGARRGTGDERWGWPWFADVVRAVQPRYVVMENVPALLADRDAFGWVLGDLADLGFDADWSVLPACAFGAPHTRERLLLLAHATGELRPARLAQEQRRQRPAEIWPDRDGQHAWGSPGVWLEAARAAHRVADGATNRMVAAGGNAVVPQVAEYVGRLIVEHASAA